MTIRGIGTKKSAKSINELIEALVEFKKVYGDLRLGDDNHWSLDLYVMPSGCLVGTEDDGTECVDIDIWCDAR